MCERPFPASYNNANLAFTCTGTCRSRLHRSKLNARELHRQQAIKHNAEVRRHNRSVLTDRRRERHGYIVGSVVDWIKGAA
jgi:hypothetical protein